VPESVPISLQGTVSDSIVVNGEQLSNLVAVGIEKNMVVLAKEAAVSSKKRKKNASAVISNQIQTAKNRSKWRNTKKKQMMYLLLSKMQYQSRMHHLRERRNDSLIQGNLLKAQRKRVQSLSLNMQL
jgi:hypothetical protein